MVAAGEVSTATAVVGKVGSPGAAVEVPAVHDIAGMVEWCDPRSLVW